MDGLVEGHELEALFLDADFLGVDGGVVGDDGAGVFVGAVDGADGADQGAVGGGGEVEQALLEGFDLEVEAVSHGVIPRWVLWVVL